MGRRITPRQNYMQDAILMRRTVAVVDADLNAPQDWKEQVKTHLHAAMRLFLERDARDVTTKPTAE